MARGWESKNVESQQEEAERGRTRGAALTAEQRRQVAERSSLQLARTRAAADLARAVAPAHRQMLQQAIDALDERLKQLG